MDRRTFLKSAGMVGAAPAVGESSPQFFSNSNRNRSNIQSTDLTPWTPSAAQTWDVHTINHLYRRAGFGATLAEIADAQGKNYSDVIDALLNDAFLTQPTVPPLPSYSDDTTAPPSWLHVPPYAYNNLLQQELDYLSATMKIRSHWTVQMNQPGTMLREKLTLFWMNHFVIEAKKVIWPQMSYNFLSYIRQHAWGNFKKMVSDITTLPAMLYYLDGVISVGSSPNENYARELQELFTMGVYYKNDVSKPNYTQADVEAIAAALTGWTIDYQAPSPNVLPAVYDVTLHNSSLVSIYDGVTRQYNLTASGASMDMDLFDHMFALDQRGNQIAWFICSELYQFFVYHDITSPDAQSVIDAMAALFIQSNWELKPVISALLKSAHFFEEANIGAEIKSPYEHLIGLLRTFDIQIDELEGGTLVYYSISGNQELLDPPNVKGWPGYHTWISTTTLPYREYIQSALLSPLGVIPSLGGSDGYSSANLYKSIYLPDILTWAQQFTNYNGTFDDFVTEVATYLCAQLPSKNALDNFVKYGYPSGYEWASLKDADKITTLRVITGRIMSLADYQLS